MFSNSIRDFAEKNKGLTPAIIMRMRTPLSVIEMTKVESLITSKLEPIEWIVLKVTDFFGKITRIEPQIVSGFSLEVIKEILEVLLESDHLKLVEFDPDCLEHNISNISKEVPEEWRTKEIDRILSRQVVKQYSLTSKGKKALENAQKEIQDVINLDLVVTGSPFKLFFDKVQLKTQSYETMELSNDLVRKILHVAIEEGKKLPNKIVPLALGGDSIINGYEVVSSDVWVTLPLEEYADHHASQMDTFEIFITSSSFIRWSNPEVSYPLSELFESEQSIEQNLINGLSYRFEMVEEIIEETLSLRESKDSWDLVCDLEMLKLIREKERGPIEEYVSEVFVPLKNNWQFGILLVLSPEDDLASRALFTARFHAKADRTGFTYDEGWQLWNELVKETGESTKKKEFDDALEILEEYKGLKRSMPKVETLVVDLEELLLKGQKRADAWKFNRIRELEDFIKKSEINQVYYYCTDKVLAKIDEEDSFKAWVKENNVEYVEDTDDEVTPAMTFAASNSFHYLGFPVPKVEGDEELRKLRIERRVIAFKYTKKLIIDVLEPIYHWYPINVLEKLYDKYYTE